MTAEGIIITYKNDSNSDRNEDKVEGKDINTTPTATTGKMMMTQSRDALEQQNRRAAKGTVR